MSELETIMAGLQDAYDLAESYNAPPDGDARYSVIVKSVKEGA